jgi:hypothetical protein
MSIAIRTEQRFLTEAEFETVLPTHYPEISTISREELATLARRLRDYRDKARDIARQQRREMRGKAGARGARPAADNTGTARKQTIFSAALKRVNRELRRFEKAEARESQSDIALRAFELKRANRVRHHPGAGRGADEGMRSTPNRKSSVSADPREVGRVSQFVKSGQARRDAKG